MVDGAYTGWPLPRFPTPEARPAYVRIVTFLMIWYTYGLVITIPDTVAVGGGFGLAVCEGTEGGGFEVSCLQREEEGKGVGQ